MTDLGTTEFTDLLEIGRGGYGVVYTAYQPSFQRTVAVKVLTLTDKHTLRRFDRERQALGKVSNHPHITPVFASGFTSDGMPYLAMELMRGGSLRERIERDGPMPWQEVLDLGVKLSGALETAHRAGILHLDIKPANVLLSDFGEPRLADFGIASIDDAEHTRTGGITASVAFAAPEVLDGVKPGVPADVYGLGATLFTLVAGKTPFSGEDDSSVLAMVVRVARDPVPDLRPRGIPDAFATVLETAMAKSAADRFPTAQALGVALREAQHQTGIRPTPMVLPTDEGNVGVVSLATTDFAMGDPTSTSGSWSDDRSDEPAWPKGAPEPSAPGGDATGETPGAPGTVGHPARPGAVAADPSGHQPPPLPQSADRGRRGRAARWAVAVTLVALAGVAAALVLLPGGQAPEDVADGDGTAGGATEAAVPVAPLDDDGKPVETPQDGAADEPLAGDDADAEPDTDAVAEPDADADEPALETEGAGTGSTADEGDGSGSTGADTRPEVDGWVAGRPVPVARQQVPGVSLRGRVWVTGGLSGDGVTTSVEGYEMATNSWRTGPDLPIPLHHHMAAAYQDDLVVMGGWTPEGALLSATTSDRVWALGGAGWMELPPLLQPRVAGAAVTVDDQLIVVGGQDADGELITTTEVFDGETWREVAPMPTPREHVAAASDGRYVYVVGGRELSADANLATVERYDPAADEWEQLLDMPTARGGLAAVVVDGLLLALGGERPLGVFAEVEALDIAEGTWTTLPPLPTGRHGLAAGAIGSGVVVIGGALEPSHSAATDVVELTGVG